MFSALRSRAAPALRSYSTSASPSTNSTNVAPIVIGGMALVAGGYFYFSKADPAALDAKKNELKDMAKDKAAAVKDTPTPKGSALSPQEFRSFKLAKVEPYNHNTASYTFELPPGTDSGLSVASALVVKAAEEGGCVDDKGKPVIRPYTPVTAPNVEGKLELLIKRYEGGKMSQHIHGLKPGQSLAIKGPIPKFQYKANEFDEVAFIAGGSGITPMWQVMQHIDANPSDKTKATLIFSNVTEQDILLRERFDDLAKRKPDQFKIVYTLDKPPSGWQGATGYVSQDLVAKHVPLPAHGDKIKVFVCGPPGQMKALSGPKVSPSDQGELKGLLADMGYTEKQVYKF